MDNRTQSRGPLFIAIVLLLLPVLYAGSYLALVEPYGSAGSCIGSEPHYPYRWGGVVASRLFWPLEQVDRKVRPKPWQPVVG